MAPEIHVDPALLRTHAAAVDEVQHLLGRITEAAKVVRLDTMWFGLFGAAIAGWKLIPLATDVASVSGALHGSVGTTAGGVRMMADQYEQVDRNESGKIGAVTVPPAPRVRPGER